MWDIILNPFITVMTALYALLGNNIVLSIVVLTIFIRLLTYPLFAKQQQSTKKMQEIQPRLKKIQEKYKDDREKLAQAQMELYKEAGVNPLGGCLPLLVQFPILIGLYQGIFFALASTPYQLVDLPERLLVGGLDGLIPLQNVWLGLDLTQPPTPPLNPAYALLLPAAVVATTWLQTRFTMPQRKPEPREDGKPDQTAAMTKSMTTIMPIMFGAISLTLSVGLSVYFLTSNMVSIFQYSPLGKRYLDPIFGIKHDDEGGGQRKKKDKDGDKDADDKPTTIEAKAESSNRKEAKNGKGTETKMLPARVAASGNNKNAKPSTPVSVKSGTGGNKSSKKRKKSRR
jgi:YidC/Oxa1 family membrane protein insertase